MDGDVRKNNGEDLGLVAKIGSVGSSKCSEKRCLFEDEDDDENEMGHAN